MKVKALRGVCNGVNSHLEAGKEYDLNESTARWFAAIGAVELVPDPIVEPKLDAKAHETDAKHTPGHPGKKEK
jgi:hypothetical protein